MVSCLLTIPAAAGGTITSPDCLEDSWEILDYPAAALRSGVIFF